MPSHVCSRNSHVGDGHGDLCVGNPHYNPEKKKMFERYILFVWKETSSFQETVLNNWKLQKERII